MGTDAVVTGGGTGVTLPECTGIVWQFFLANSETAVVFYSFIQSNDSRDSVGRSKETEDFFSFF
jgi:hypothetical protein